jgi:alcohol dehydrogenase class IV
MKEFTYFQPTEIIFGSGKVAELGNVAKRFGNKCLLVTTPTMSVLEPMYQRVKKILTASGLDVTHFDGIQPNPTTDDITAGAEMAVSHGAEMVIGFGGGSSMDSAKSIAIEATHEGTCWDYLYFRETQPTQKTLPVIAISTTSGTGSQVTQVAVVTNTVERTKSAIYNSIVYPKVAIVDPELMSTVPEYVTSATAFDAFCHSFESMLNPRASVYTDTLALKSIRLITETLPGLLKNLDDIQAREKMAVADTFAGLCIANSGVTLPHGVGMAISGLYPHVAHGASLSIIYPAFSRFTFPHAIEQFAALGRILNPELVSATDEEAAENSCEEIDIFIKKIGLWMNLKDIGMPENEIPLLSESAMVLPDNEANPRVAALNEMNELIKESYYR